MRFLPGCGSNCCGTNWCFVSQVCDANGGTAHAQGGVTVTIKGPSGTTVGTCTTAGQVTAINFGIHGSGYTSAPTVIIGAPPPGGTQATAIATVSAGQVQSVTVTNPGGGYTSAPNVTFSGGGGTGAAAFASLRQGCCSKVPNGTGYTATFDYPGYVDQTVTISNQSNNTITVTLNKAVSLPSTLNATDSVYGPFASTAASSYTTNKTNSGTYVADCVNFIAATGNWAVAYKLLNSNCGMTLQIIWYSCDCSGSTAPTLTNVNPTFCGGGPAQTVLTIDADLIQASPLMIRFTIPSEPAWHGIAMPYPSGGTVTFTS